MTTLRCPGLAFALALLATAAHAQTPETPAPPVLNAPPVAPPPAAAPATPAPSPLLGRATPVPRRYPQSSLALGIGWGAPYGWGLEYSHMAAANWDVNVGLGFTVSGGKLGVGGRYYFAPERRVSGWLGLNAVHSTGVENVTVTSNTNRSSSAGGGYYNSTPAPTGVISYRPGNLLHLRGGLRWQPVHRFAMFGGLGYGICYSGGDLLYVSGTFDQPTRDALRLLAPGGLEVSVGVALGFH